MQQTVTGKIQWVIVQSILGHVDQGCEPPPPPLKWPSPSTDIALNGALSCDIEKTPSSLYWVLIYVSILKLKLELQLLTWEPPTPPPPAVCTDSFCAALGSHTTSSLSHCPQATWLHVQKQQPRGVAICQTSKVQKFLQWTSLNLHSLDFDWHQMQAPSQNVGS